MDQERFEELSAEFLLSGLSGAELTEFEAELERRGAAGQQELARMREAIASLALVPATAEPSPELRRGLLARIEAPAESLTADTGAPARLAPLPRRRWEWIVAAAVAAGLAVLLALWSVKLRSDLARAEEGLGRAMSALRRMESELRRADGELTSARERLARADSAQTALEGYRRDLEAVASPRSKAHTLTGTADQPHAFARVFIDPVTGRALLFAFELPILPPGKVYELWAIKGNTPVAAGTFSTGDDERARVELSNAQVLDGADALAITIEPAPGVPKPTGKMVLTSTSS